jgi:hypothetical protein
MNISLVMNSSNILSHIQFWDSIIKINQSNWKKILEKIKNSGNLSLLFEHFAKRWVSLMNSKQYKISLTGRMEP